MSQIMIRIKKKNNKIGSVQYVYIYIFNCYNLPENSKDPEDDILKSKIAACRKADDDQTDTDPLGYSLPFHVYEPYLHLKTNKKLTQFNRY